MPLPVKALQESHDEEQPRSRLIIHSDRTSVSKSAHVVSKAIFSNTDGIIQDAFYKPVDNNSYPELLAKFVVAGSVSMRMTVGNQIDENRLVFDKDGNTIIGTMSVAIPGFKPMACIGEMLPQDPFERELVCPSTVITLFITQAIPVLLELAYSIEDDGHSRNFAIVFIPPPGLSDDSLENAAKDLANYQLVSIDRDMTFYHHTVIYKGNRLTDAILSYFLDKKAVFGSNLLDNFPITTGLTHSPTNTIPGNGWVPKSFASSSVFQALAKNPVFETDAGAVSCQEQTFTALIRKLIVYDSDMLQVRLVDELSNVPLDFMSLPDDKVKKLMETYPDLYNHKTNDKPFVDFWRVFYQKEYDRVYLESVFYKGCEKNDSGVPVTSFLNFIQNKPSAYHKAIQWATEQNSLMVQAWHRYQSQKGYTITLVNNNIPDDAIQAYKIYLYLGIDNTIECAAINLDKKIERIMLADRFFNDAAAIKKILSIQSEMLNDLQVKKLFQLLAIKGYSDGSGTLPVRSKYCVSPEGHYDLAKIDQRYHQVWRDAHVFVVQDILSELNYVLKKMVAQSTIKPFKGSINCQAQIGEEPAIETCIKPDKELLTDKIECTTAWQLFNKSTLTVNLVPHGHQDNGIYSGVDCLNQFIDELTTYCHDYYTIPCTGNKLSIDDNRRFIEKISTSLSRHLPIIDNHLMTTESRMTFNAVVKRINEFITMINFDHHKMTSDKDLCNSTDCLPALNHDHRDKEVVNAYLNALFDWAKTCDKEGFNDAILTILHGHYKPVIIPKNRYRSDEVENYLKESTESGDNKLAYILSTGGKESTSLNTQLIKYLVPIVLNFANMQVNINLRSISYAYKEGQFDVELYTLKAIDYVSLNIVSDMQEPRFTHLYSYYIKERFISIIYNYIDNLDKKSFQQLITSVLENYHKQRPYFSNFSFFNSSRDVTVKTYLKDNPNKINRDIISYIWSEKDHGWESNSLNTILFNCLLDNINKKIKAQHVEEENSDNFMLQINLTNVDQFNHYTAILKATAMAQLTASVSSQLISAISP